MTDLEQLRQEWADRREPFDRDARAWTGENVRVN